MRLILGGVDFWNGQGELAELTLHIWVLNEDVAPTFTFDMKCGSVAHCSISM